MMATTLGLSILPWLIDATIKGSIVILLIAAIQILVGKRLAARWRYLLWLLVIVRLALPVAPSASFSLFNLLPGSPAQVIPANVQLRSQGPGVHDSVAEVVWIEPQRWSGLGAALFTVWAFVALLLLGRLVVASLRLQFAIRTDRTKGREDLRHIVSEGCRQLGIHRHVEIVESDVVNSPALHGGLHPTLIFPSRTVQSFEPEELRHIVLHELWHLRRFDVVVNWVLSIIQALHWFNPLVWFTMVRIREERELACDELALSCLEEEERSSYGRTILKLLSTFRTAAPIPAIVGIVNQKHQMKRRLTMIATFRNRTRFSLLFVVIVVAVGALALTDASAGDKRIRVKDLDPAAHATFMKLDQKISFELTDASLNDFIATVSNRTGVPITQSPALATEPIQNARFTVKAENVPAHLVLHKALSCLGAGPVPDAAGVTIEAMKMRHHMNGEACEPGHEGMMIKREHVESNGDSRQTESTMKVLDGKAAEGTADKHIFVRRIAESEETGDDRHCDLTLKFEENGVVSEGRLILSVDLPEAE